MKHKKIIKAEIKALAKWIFISVLWQILEIALYREIRPSNEDTIIGCILLWYIWKSEIAMETMKEDEDDRHN